MNKQFFKVLLRMMKRVDFLKKSFWFDNVFSQLCISYYNCALKYLLRLYFFPTDIHNDDTWYMRKQGNLIAYYYR